MGTIYKRKDFRVNLRALICFNFWHTSYYEVEDRGHYNPSPTMLTEEEVTLRILRGEKIKDLGKEPTQYTLVGFLCGGIIALCVILLAIVMAYSFG